MSNVTKRALEASLKRLLLQKPLTKITINDIAEDCGISRMTFYYDTWQEGFLNIFNAVLENKPFIVNVYRCVSREQIERYLYQLIHSLIIGVIEEKAEGMDVSERDKRLIADFYEYAFVGIMLDWISHDMKEDPKYLVDRVSTLIHGDITRALGKFRTDKSLSNCPE